MTKLSKDFKRVVVTGSQAIEGIPAVPGRPGYYTQALVVTPGSLTTPNVAADQPVINSTPATTQDGTNVTSTGNTDPRWRIATREEITIMLIGSTYEDQPTVYSYSEGKRVPVYSRCDITLMELTLAASLPEMHVRVPYQMPNARYNGTSNIALAFYSADAVMAPAFCVGTFPDPRANTAYDPAFESDPWQADEVYDCEETASGIVTLSLKYLGGLIDIL